MSTRKELTLEDFKARMEVLDDAMLGEMLRYYTGIEVKRKVAGAVPEIMNKIIERRNVLVILMWERGQLYLS